MKILEIVLIYFCVSELSAYSITPIEGLDSLTLFVDFDAEGNTYAVSSKDGNLYKLSPSDEVLWSTHLSYDVSEMLVNHRGDAYINLQQDFNRTLGTVKANSTKVEIISEITYGLFYLDNEDNFYYSRYKGAYLLRPRSSSPVPISNLEDFNFLDGEYRVRAVSDKSGNTYLLLENENNSSLVVITKEALQEEKPYATFLYPFENSSSIVDLTVDVHDNVWVSAKDSKEHGVIKRLVNGNWETVLTDEKRAYNTMMHTKERTYIQSSVWPDSADSIYYITSNDEVVEIPELKDIHAYLVHNIADSEGQAYFYTAYEDISSSLGQFITILPNEQEPIPVTIGQGLGKSAKAKFDANNDLWFLNSFTEIHHLKKGETVPDRLNNPNGICEEYWDINVNFVTGKIYVSCHNGLFTVINN